MDLVCFSHLRWNFVYQRPQHLLSRFAKKFRVFYIEEPIFEDRENDHAEINKPEENLWTVTPHLPHNLSEEEILIRQKSLLKKLFSDLAVNEYIFWYYTPMALELGKGFTPDIIVYDCMDELSNFKFASPVLREREKELFSLADIVFTGGHNLYKAKKSLHHNIYPFPSSIDKEHFAQAKKIEQDPDDQKNIPHPRFGFYGVVDERFDIDLIKNVAEKKPEWNFIILGPVVKIDPATLPQLPNIHYLGGKSYKDLPLYLSGWDICMIPFAINESTEFISPTKTPEYLAAGKPVISTPIIDVVTPYGDNKLVHIISDADQFINAAETELSNSDKTQWQNNVDEFLNSNSWDKTWSSMMELINIAMESNNKKIFPNLKPTSYV